MMEIAENAELFGWTQPRRWPKPGEYWQHLPEEIKEVLKDLKSDDLKNVRWPRF